MVKAHSHKRSANKLTNAMRHGLKIGQQGYKGYKKITDFLKPKQTRKSYRNPGVKVKNSKPLQVSSYISQHNDISIDKFNLIIRKKPLVGSKDKIKYVEDLSYILSSPEGVQGVFTPRAFFSIPQMIGPVTNTRNTQYQQPISFFQMNPNAKITGSAYITGAGTQGAVTTDSRINILKGHCDMEVLNMSNLATTVWVYFYLCKRNTTRTPKDAWADALTNQSQGQIPLVTAGSGLATTSTPGSVSVNVCGNFPNDALLKKYWRLLKVKKFVLQGGDNHKLEYEMHINKQMLYSELLEAQAADTTMYYKGLTIYPMIITKGGIVSVTDTNVNEITYGKTKVGVLFSNKYTLSVPKEPPSAPIVIGKYDILVGTHSENIINDVDATDTVKQV